ncbi:HAD family hydrolase [Caloramator sp. E03]|uniref:HAD family hydrolase n=1 Tax=Caloramator sp. E03 TaxID=2576307 RepID=UPI0011103DF0|nr:HAD family hydrolase [Caloramator sp. E03]QCX32392.1 HAD family hydrolase [Caloramator sp. E03]
MNTILFDLDGTLLPYKWEDFEKEYFKKMVYKLKDLFTPKQTIEYILDATKEMIMNTDCNKTNEEVFMDKFCKISGQEKEKMYKIFKDFYDKEYRTISGIFTPSKYVINSIKTLKEKGYTLVVATNPIFPMEAIIQRVNWAGLDEKDFILITSFEIMHYCKPQIKYYDEILNVIDKKPFECMMVGNDVSEDLIAGKLGIKTYLITDYMINKNNIEPKADYVGTYEDFYNFVQKLPYALNDEAVAQ